MSISVVKPMILLNLSKQYGCYSPVSDFFVDPGQILFLELLSMKLVRGISAAEIVNVIVAAFFTMRLNDTLVVLRLLNALQLYPKQYPPRPACLQLSKIR